jgi:hypothetical protein
MLGTGLATGACGNGTAGRSRLETCGMPTPLSSADTVGTALCHLEGTHMSILLRFVALALSGVLCCAASAAVHDDCHAEAEVYLAARPYIINPAVKERAQTTVVALVSDRSVELGLLPYRFEVRSESGTLVYLRRGIELVGSGGSTELLLHWDGRGADRRALPDGEYDIRVVTRADAWNDHWPLRLDDAWVDRRLAAGPLAEGSSVQVVVDGSGAYDRLFVREHTVGVTREKAASLDSGFGYQFFFGSTHAHSNWSDGGMPVTHCSSGRYGYVGGARPVDAWAYARNTAKLDFLAVVEHNHLMQEACPSCTTQGVKDRYAAGFSNAANATVNGSFVALFGMEWGVISGGGHINIYNQNRLMAWAGEPYHVLTPKSDYPKLYTALRNNQPANGSYGTFNHPTSTDFGSFVRTADGDAVMRGMSLVSGPAFSTSTSFTPGGTRYDARYKQALSYGWRIGPEAQQDNHCWNYGTSTPNRTVALLPNGTTLSQSSLLAAINARRFYASEDRDAQLIFRTSNGSSVMGASFNSPNNSIAFTAKVLDPSGEGVQKIEIWGGVAGTRNAPGAAAAIQASNRGSTTLMVTLPRKTAGQRWYYYVRAVQADGDVLWSAPIWILWQ